MKENKYDNETFFKNYSQMDRSKKGLAAAGEWPSLEKLLPDFQGKEVLDLGCGYGWHCIYAAEHGAKAVLGIDLSKKMLAVAKEKTTFPNVHYQLGAIEEVDFPENSFDIVISSLALHYIEDFEGTIKKIHHYLKPDGFFVFSVEHPIFTAEGSQDWIYDEAGIPQYFPIDRYFEEGARATNFLGETVQKYHRTLTTYLDSLLLNGFQIQRIVEPTPPEDMLDIPGMINEFRRPMMIIIKAKNT